METDCDIVGGHLQDMTLCEQDDELIINPDTNHNHQPLLSSSVDDSGIKGQQQKQQNDDGLRSRTASTEDSNTKDSSTVS